MTVFFRQRIFCMLPLAAALMFAMHNEAISQNAAQTRESEAKATKPVEIKTLDQVRHLASRNYLDDLSQIHVTSGTLEIIPELDLAIKRTPFDPRKLALKKIEEAKAKLKSSEDRSAGERLLGAALAEYFIADMQHRVRELDEIKAKVAESESKLQKRLDSQEESLDLQMKLMLREVDGQGFFRKDDATRLSSPTLSAETSDALTSPGSSANSSFSPAGGSGIAPRLEKEPVAPELLPLTKVLSKTQTIVLVVDDMLWEHYRLPASFDDESFKQLAGAILKAMGSGENSKNLLWDNSSARLDVRFTTEGYEQFGKNIPGVIEVLRNSSDARQKQREAAATKELLLNNDDTSSR